MTEPPPTTQHEGRGVHVSVSDPNKMGALGDAAKARDHLHTNFYTHLPPVFARELCQIALPTSPSLRRASLRSDIVRSGVASQNK